MHILLHDYSGHGYTTELARDLAAAGHRIDYCYSASVNAPRGDLQQRPTDPATLSMHGISSSKPIPKTNFVLRWQLEREYGQRFVQYISESKPDIVVCACTPSIVAAYASRYCQRAKIRYVSWVQDLYGVAGHKILRKKIPIIGSAVGNYLIHLDRQALKRSAAAICITEDFVPFVQSAGVSADLIHILHNWAPLDQVPVRPRENPWSQKMGLTSGMRFLYSGTLAMKHNPNLLLQLAKSLAGWGEGEVIIVSEGPGADWLRERSAAEGVNNIKIFGYQPFSDLPDVLGSADVTVVLLEPDAGTYSVPSKVLSYLCSGRPILGAIPKENLAAKTVQIAKAGLVSSPNDIDEWVKIARELYCDPGMRQSLGASGREYAVSNFEKERIVSKFLQIVQATAV